MLFNRLFTALARVRSRTADLRAIPVVLIYNKGLELWAILDLSSDHDKIDFFEDPRNVMVCVITLDDLTSLPATFEVQAFEKQLAEAVTVGPVPPGELPFSVLYGVLTLPQPPPGPAN